MPLYFKIYLQFISNREYLIFTQIFYSLPSLVNRTLRVIYIYLRIKILSSLFGKVLIILLTDIKNGKVI
jgi:hypothetical protein